MDNLLKQMRPRQPGVGQEIKEEQGSSSRDRKLAPQKSLSFKEKKTTGSWLRKQFSRQMSRGKESDDGIEHVTAVAAAVFAVYSIEESENARHRRNVDRTETPSFTKIKNTREDTRVPPPRPAPDPVKLSGRLSDEDLLRNPKAGSAGKVAATSEQQKQKPEKVTDPFPSFRKTPTFSDTKTDISGSRREPDRPAPRPPTPRPPTPWPSTPPIARKPSTGPTDTNKPVVPPSTRSSAARETKADVWEKAEMAKIKEKYEKVHDTISYWESRKRDKALGKLEATQGVGVSRRKRERGRKKLAEDMEFIKQIAGEARAKADAKRRNEVLKAKQKADILRETGELPVTCFCC